MKNRRYKYLLIILLALIIIWPKDASAKTFCLRSQMAELEKQALKAKASSKLVRGQGIEAYYEITFTNLDSRFVVMYNGESYASLDGGLVTIPYKFEPNKEYIFEIYTGNDFEACSNSMLTSKKVRLPYYNVYSEREECIEYEEFPLCSINYKGEIEDSVDFQTKLREWLESTKSEVEEYKDTRNIIQMFTDWYNDHLQISVTLTIIFGLLLLAYIIRAIIRKIKRAKVKI